MTEGARGSGSYAVVDTIKPYTVTPELDSSGIILVIDLNNAAIIDSNRYVFVKIQNIKNPPSTAPVSGFYIYTADQSDHLIEESGQGELQNQLPG